MNSRWHGILTVSLAMVALGGSTSAQEIQLLNYRFDPLQHLPVLDPGLHRATPEANRGANYIVQFDGPITPQDRAWAELNATVLGYLPDYAFLVQTTPDLASNLESLDGVRWVGAWEPGYKLSPTIGQKTFLSEERARDPWKTLRLTTHGSWTLTREKILGEGAVVIEVIERAVKDRFIVKADEATLPALARLEEVLWIEEVDEYVLSNTTTSWVLQTNINGQRRVWNQGIRGEGQMAIAMDSGLDYNSCWFRDPGKTPGPTHRKVKYYDWFGGAEYDGCGLGHGSHVCGTIAGDQSYINPGNEQHNGLAPSADLGMQDIGNDDFFSCLFGFVFPPSDLTNAFQQAFDAGARVHTNSWGSASNSYDGYAVDIDDFMFRRPDMLILFANGNSGPGAGSVGSPATAKNCISVGATRQSPQQETITGYSSRGPANDGRLKPTVAAPGGGDGAASITSVDNNSGNPPGNSCNSTGLAGTSMATPAVAGASLLVRDYFSQGFYPSGEAAPADSFDATGALVKAVIVNCAADMGGANIPNNNEGWGRVLLDDALYFDGDSLELRVEEDLGGLQTGEFREYTWDVAAGEKLEITLVWSDAPGTQGANPALVNNLNLTVTGPGGTYRGNVFSGGQSTTGGSADNRNVEESVLLQTPPAGTYTVRVDGTNVPNGPQHFALVATGSFDNWPSLCTEDAQWANYGSGHPGTNGVPSLTATDPILGSSMTLDVGNSLGSATTGTLFIGFNSASIPGFGGTLLVDPSFLFGLSIPAAGASLPGDLPADSELCGVSLFLQVLELDAGASDGVSFTPGVELQLGS